MCPAAIESNLRRCDGKGIPALSCAESDHPRLSRPMFWLVIDSPTGTPMATITVSKSAAQSQPGAYDRAFYSTFAIVMALAVLAGFAPTYFFKLLRGGPMLTLSHAPFNSLVWTHAILFTSWVALFVVQTALVARHRVAVHRKLGVAGGVLAAAMVMVGLATAITTARRGGGPPGADPLAFMAIPVFDMVMFATFVATALLQRRNKDVHKRLMVLAYLSIITAALARLPGILPRGPLAFYGLTFALLAAVVIYDWVSRGRIHKVYLWGATALVLSVPLRLLLSATHTWKAFAEFLTR